ncbi:MAG: hypothetical protein HY908_14030 [Myxococcales bacterium]|nr:hypothetical protein [Myxococcales bacterium]
MSTARFPGWLLAPVAWLACAGGDKPVDPVWGKQPCAACAMLVSEPRHAGQLVTESGDRFYFDDPGCLAAYLAERTASAEPAARVGAAWVRDEAGSWIDARSARYRTGARTPMDYGFEAQADGTASFADVERAARDRGRR